MSGSRPTEGGGPVGPRIQIITCEPCYTGAARYKLSIAIGNLHLSNVVVLRQGNDWWTALPTRPKLDTNGKAMGRNSGGYVSEPIVEIPNPESKRRFDSAVMAALNTYLSAQEAS